MSPRDALLELQSRSLVTADEGKPCSPRLLPPLNPAAIKRLEESIGAPIPLEIRELLSSSAGVEIDHEVLDWTGQVEGQMMPDVLPLSLPIMGDGAGNSWNVDIDPATGAWAAVYFVCHDAPVLVFQAASLAEFIIQFADDCCQPEREGSLHFVAERCVGKIWSDGGELVDPATFDQSEDPFLRQAACGLEHAMICDLRTPRLGRGFSWGRFASRTRVLRCGPAPVWVISKAPAKRWWQRRAS